ncbi:MAG: class I SAM-dependent methyltransferase [Patescibacteria group bacterium]
MQPTKTMRPEDAKEYTKRVQSWWNDHPFTLGLAAQEGDYDITGRVQELDEHFFREVDRKMRKQYGTSGQAEGAPLLSNLVPYADIRGKKVLDIAVGSGWSSVTLAKAGAEVTGIDLTEEAIRMTKRHAEVRGVNVTVQQMDAQEMSFPDATFDYVLAWGCVMHMPDTERALRQINRVLKPGGKMLAYMYNKSSWTYWFNFIFLRGILCGKLLSTRGNTTAIVSRYTDGAPKGGNMLTKVYSPSEATRMYEAAGYTNVRAWPFYIPHEVDGWPMAKFPFFRYFPMSVKKWMGERWAWGLIVTGEKDPSTREARSG